MQNDFSILIYFLLCAFVSELCRRKKVVKQNRKPGLAKQPFESKGRYIVENYQKYLRTFLLFHLKEEFFFFHYKRFYVGSSLKKSKAIVLYLYNKSNERFCCRHKAFDFKLLVVVLRVKIKIFAPLRLNDHFLFFCKKKARPQTEGGRGVKEV